MIRRFLLLLFLAPALELLFLLWLGSSTWAYAVFGIALASAALGVWIIRRQGLQTVRRMQADMQDGRPPAQSLLDGLCRFLAGVLLVVPSVTADLVGLALLLPLTRRLLQAWLGWNVLGRMNANFSGFSARSFSPQGFSAAGGGGRMAADSIDDSDVIDVEFAPTRQPPKHLPR